MKLTMTFLSFAVATAFAIVLTINIATTKRGGTDDELLVYSDDDYKISSRDKLSIPGEDKSAVISKRVSRFLAQEDARPKFHCNKDNDVCNEAGSPGSTCCNNKCIDVMTDSKNCGACKNKCKYTETCCNGQCVNVNFDKRHCGNCGKKCMKGGYCIYGMCDYA